VLILGALSALAEATARLYAAEGVELLLVGRNPARLAEVAADLTARGAVCHVQAADLAATADPFTTLESWIAPWGGVDVVFLFYGALGDQALAETNVAEARRIIGVNFGSAAEWALAAAARLEAQKGGVLIVVGSVAGDRGRRSNYVYGAAKGGLAVLVQGLAHRLAKANARAVMLKLGLVDTPMTAGMSKGGMLWSTPEGLAPAIKRAAAHGGPVVYAPWFWRWILLAIRATPSALLHKTNL
jgi:decaprenylphospho-beta-D-erythro-pentofuranosid-2-ulose 2-reductase